MAAEPGPCAEPRYRLCDSREAAERLRAGEPLLIPTDTVVGLGISVAHNEGPDQLFRIKRRDHSKPIAWLIADASDLLTFGRDVPQTALELARQHWPGALTLVVRAADCVNPAFASQDGTIALRVPDCDGARELIRLVGSPLATSSANVSGAASATCLDQVDPRILEFAPWAVSDVAFASTQPSGVASAVVDCTGGRARILRQGSLDVSDALL